LPQVRPQRENEPRRPCTVVILSRSSGTGSASTTILAFSEMAGVPAKALRLSRRSLALKRIIAPLSLLFVVALAGCSSTPGTVASSVSPAGSAVASSVSPAGSAVASSVSPTEAAVASPTSTPVAGGAATDFCGAFKELQALNDAPSGDLATMGAQFQAAAADMRKYAPAEIKDAANTYAAVMDNIGKAAAGGTFDEAALQKAIADGMAGNAKDIGTTAVWVAKNCSL
jgi:hypothetical protein